MNSWLPRLLPGSASRFALVVLLLGIAAPVQPARAAINPEAYVRVASHHLHLRQIARIVEDDRHAEPTHRRVTIVAEVLAADPGVDTPAGSRIVIDWTVDLTARAAAAETHERENGRRPGPQFMHEPDAPDLDAQGRFWAHLAPAGGRLGNVNRFAGAVIGAGSTHVSGPVFVPVAGQYSFAP